MTGLDIKNLPFLDKEEYFDHFARCWDNLAHSFLKIELLDYYEEGKEGPFQDYLKKDWDKFARKLKEMEESEKEDSRKIIEGGLRCERVHVVPQEPTRYLSYEWCSYVVSEKLGERIYAVLEQNAPEAKGLKDLAIFDDTDAFILKYDEIGILEGAWHEREPGKVRRLIDLYEKLRNKSLPFKDIYPIEPAMLDRLYNGGQ